MGIEELNEAAEGKRGGDGIGRGVGQRSPWRRWERSRGRGSLGLGLGGVWAATGSRWAGGWH